MAAAGYVLAAGGIAAANEIIFTSGGVKEFNWRLIPATGILALVLTGFEKMSPQFGSALGGLVLFMVLITPMGNAPPPIENIAKMFGKQ